MCILIEAEGEMRKWTSWMLGVRGSALRTWYPSGFETYLTYVCV
jgi:hypothetical protein